MRERLFAVLVGVSEYDNGWASLPGALYDVGSIALAIERTHDPSLYELYVLASRKTKPATEAPTKTNILNVLRTVSQKVTTADYVLFFFAGHGLLFNGRTCLLPKDSTPVFHLDPSTMLSLDEIAACFSDTPCEHKIMLLDACNTIFDNICAYPSQGEKIRSRGMASVSYVRAHSQIPKGWVTLTACGPGQESYEEGFHGLFSQAIAQALRGEADLDSDGVTSIAKFAQYITQRVKARSKARMKREQIPTLFASGVQMDSPVMPKARYSEQSDLPHKWRRRSPGRDFLKVWFEKSIKPLSADNIFYPGMFMWGIGVIFITILILQASVFVSNRPTWFSLGLANLLVWRATVALSFAAAERRWHWGGYLPSLLIGAVLFTDSALFVLLTKGASDILQLSLVLAELLFLLPVVSLNALNTILSLGHLIAKGEAVVVEEVFLRFDKEWWNIEIPNIMPFISAKQLLYTWVVGVGISIMNLSNMIWLSTHALDARIMPYLSLDALAILLAWWIVGWYQSAFLALKKKWWPQV